MPAYDSVAVQTMLSEVECPAEGEQLAMLPPALAEEKETRSPRPAGRAKSLMEEGEGLVKILEKIQGIEGVSVSEAWRDFLEITELTLLRLPANANAILRTGKPEETDPPEVAARWQAVVKRYRKPQDIMAIFQQGFVYLLDKSTDEHGEPTYIDVLGKAHEQLLGRRTAEGLGQFFTPAPVSLLIAELLMGGGQIEELVEARLREAIEKSEPAKVLGAVMGICPDKEKVDETTIPFLMRFIRPYYEPVTIMDPCVGSGGLLLAAASIIPRAYVAECLVEFYGMDIDRTCVQMTSINTMLYGLNGWTYRVVPDAGAPTSIKAGGGVWAAEDAPEAVVTAVPEPAQSVYREVRAHPDQADRPALRKRILEGQMSLFSMTPEKVEVE